MAIKLIGINNLNSLLMMNLLKIVALRVLNARQGAPMTG
jgi:hypothetical protein